MKIESAGLSDVGQVREKNEDSILIDDEHHLYLVADGMGGHLGGAVASSLAAETFQTFVVAAFERLVQSASAQPAMSSLVPRLLTEGMRVTCQRVFHTAQQDQRLSGMGTTLTAMWMHSNRAFVAHVGDSRCYLMREGKLLQLTDDHSLVNEHVQAGLMTEEEAKNSPFRNMITRSIGFESEVAVDTLIVELQTDDQLLLCSDGLNNHIDDLEILEVWSEHQELDGFAQTLVDKANEEGGEDNISVVVMKVAELAVLTDDDDTVADDIDSAETPDPAEAMSENQASTHAMFAPSKDISVSLQ